MESTQENRFLGYLKRNALVIFVSVVLLLVGIIAPRWAFELVLNLMQSTGDLMARLTAAFQPIYSRTLDNVFVRIVVYMAPAWLWLGGELVAYLSNRGAYSVREALFKRDGMFSITTTLGLISMILVCGAPFVYMAVGLGSSIIMLLPVLRSYQALMTARNLTRLVQICAQLMVTQAALLQAKASGQTKVKIKVPDFNSTGLEMKFWSKWAWLILSLSARLIIGLLICYGFPLVCALP